MLCIILPKWQQVILYLKTSTALVSCSLMAARLVTLSNKNIPSLLCCISTGSCREANLDLRNSRLKIIDQELDLAQEVKSGLLQEKYCTIKSSQPAEHFIRESAASSLILGNGVVPMFTRFIIFPHFFQMLVFPMFRVGEIFH